MKIIISLIFMIFSMSAFSEYKTAVYLIHINGINTTDRDAEGNLQNLMGSIRIYSNMIHWDYIYNPTNVEEFAPPVRSKGIGNLLSNLFDVMNQKAHEGQIITINDYVDSYMKTYGLDYPVDSPEYNALKKQMQPIYNDAFQKAAGDNFPYILNRFLTKFPPPAPGNYANTGDFYILIPHSQGNLYANALYEYLISNYHMPQSHIAIYGIGNAASSNKGSWIADTLGQANFPNMTSYTTSSNDFVIGGLRVLSNVLPSNITVPLSSVDYLGHNLVSIYLSNPYSLEQIRKMIDLYAYYLIYSNTAANYNGSYYKLYVRYAWTTKNGALVDPSGELICHNGVCDPDDFDYFTPHEEDCIRDNNAGCQQGWDGGVAFMRPDKFIPGMYTGLSTLEYGHPSGQEIYVQFKNREPVIHNGYDEKTSSCNSFSSSDYRIYPWSVGTGFDSNTIKSLCPSYILYNMFISEKAIIP